MGSTDDEMNLKRDPDWTALEECDAQESSDDEEANEEQEREHAQNEVRCCSQSIQFNVT